MGDSLVERILKDKVEFFNMMCPDIIGNQAKYFFLVILVTND